MKKRILSIVLAICMLVPCMIHLTACKDNPPPDGDELTSAEMSTIYKDVALSTWSEIGVADPTTQAVGSAVGSVPDKKVETTVANDVLQVKMQANNMAGVLYLIGSLYANSNFALTSGVAKFSATATMGGSSHEYDFTIEPKLDTAHDKVYLEAYIVVDTVMPQYIVVDADYDFENKSLVSFRLYTFTSGMYIDIELTADDKNMFYATTDATDTFAVALEAEKSTFISETASVSELSFSFSTEFQTYMTLVQKVVTDLLG